MAKIRHGGRPSCSPPVGVIFSLVFLNISRIRLLVGPGAGPGKGVTQFPDFVALSPNRVNYLYISGGNRRAPPRITADSPNGEPVPREKGRLDMPKLVAAMGEEMRGNDMTSPGGLRTRHRSVGEPSGPLPTRAFGADSPRKWRAAW